MILRLIGLAVLVLLGIILSVLLLVLLVPVRYSLSGSYKDKIRAAVKITWLLHAVSVKAVYEDELDITVKLLGKQLFKEKEDLGEPAGNTAAEESGEEMSVPDTAAEESEEDVPAPDLTQTEMRVDWIESGTSPAEVQEAAGEKPRSGENPKPAAGSNYDWEEELWEQEENISGTSKEQKRKKKQKEKKGKNPANLKERITGLLASLKEKWDKVLEYKEKGTSFLENEENQKTIKLIFRQCRALIRHILPRKLKIRAVLGFNDPSVTGNVLAVLGILYAWYGDNIEITPVFDQKILDAEGSLKGHIRAGTLLVLVIRVLLNKNFRLLVRRWRRNGGI